MIEITPTLVHFSDWHMTLAMYLLYETPGYYYTSPFTASRYWAPFAVTRTQGVSVIRPSIS